jgi:iron-sulfur cluster repair protein YtfE (RIC family)
MITNNATLALPTQPLRDEHRELLPAIARLRQAADAVGDVPLTALRQMTGEAYEFLTQRLLPHAHAEEGALYPAVGRALGAPEATATMSRDHIEIERLTDELAGLLVQLAAPTLRADQQKALRRVLYGLYTLISVHLVKEEEVYLPLLDARLTPDQVRQLLAEMEEAAQEAQRLPSD